MLFRDPNNPGNAVWPEYNLNEQYLALKPNMEAKRKLRADHMAFWNILLPKLKNLCPDKSNDYAEEDGDYLTTNEKNSDSKLLFIVWAKQLAGFGYFIPHQRKY